MANQKWGAPYLCLCGPGQHVRMEGDRPEEIVMGYWQEVISIEEDADVLPLEIWLDPETEDK
jgi:hypothetical protein